MNSESIEIKCSSCWEPLVDILTYDKQLDEEFSICCECPYCGDRSYYEKLTNKFYVSAKDGILIVDSEQQENGSMIIKTEKI
jgi:hypothetical protein